MSERASTTTQKQAATRVTPSISGFLQRKCACGNHTVAGGECEGCKGKKGMLQRASISPRGRGTEGEGEVPPIVHDVLRSPGHPLDAATRGFMEPRFGHDFSGVRVHTDAKAAESARAVNAQAYTVGRDMVFDAGQYVPKTEGGKTLIAHELAHVRQQAQGPISSNLSVVSPSDPSEIEATQAASTILGPTKGAFKPTTTMPPQLSRAPKPPSTQSTTPLPASQPNKVETLMVEVLKGLDTPTKRSLLGKPGTGSTGFKTLVIAELTHVDNAGKVIKIEYRYATNSNWKTANLEEVTAAHGLDFIDEIIVGAAHGETTAIDVTGRRVFLSAMCVSRPVCVDCQTELIEHAKSIGMELFYEKRGALTIVRLRPGSTGSGKLKSISSGILKNLAIGAATAAIALSDPKEAQAAGKSDTSSEVAKPPTSGTSQADPRKGAQQPITPPTTKPQPPATGVASTSAAKVEPPAQSSPKVAQPPSQAPHAPPEPKVEPKPITAAAKPATPPPASTTAPNAPTTSAKPSIKSTVPVNSPATPVGILPTSAGGAAGSTAKGTLSPKTVGPGTRSSGSSGAVGGAVIGVAAQIVIIIGTIIAQRFMDEQNKAAIEKALKEVQPEIEKSIITQTEVISERQAKGENAYAYISITINHGIDPQTSLNIFTGLKFNKLEIGDNEIEQTESRPDESLLKSLAKIHMGMSSVIIKYSSKIPQIETKNQQIERLVQRIDYSIQQIESELTNASTDEGKKTRNEKNRLELIKQRNILTNSLDV